MLGEKERSGGEEGGEEGGLSALCCWVVATDRRDRWSGAPAVAVGRIIMEDPIALRGFGPGRRG